MKRAALVLVLVAGTAHANRWTRAANEAQGGAWLHYELSAVTDDDAAHPHELVLAGARLHGFVGTGNVIGWHAGIDLAAGSTLRAAGLAYDVALLPVGVGVRIGRTSVIALGTGVGAIGAVGTIDDAVTWPIEATLELGGGRVRVLGRARAAWVAGAERRHDGAPSIAFADELDTMLGLRIGHHYEDYMPSGNGYFAGIAYRELAGAKYVGAVIGYSIDLASPPHHSRHRRGI